MIHINQLNEEAVVLLNSVYKVYPEDKPIEHWLQLCDEGKAFLFVQVIDGLTTYAGVVELCNKGLLARFGGGVDNKWDVKEVHDFLVDACRDFNKKYLRLKGRAGWKKHLLPLGFKIIREEQQVALNGRIVSMYEKQIR